MNETNEANAMTKETRHVYSFASDNSKSPYQSDTKEKSVTKIQF